MSLFSQINTAIGTSNAGQVLVYFKLFNLELEKGDWLSVAVSMPLPAWLEKADVVILRS